MSKVFCFLFCVMCVNVVTAFAPDMRFRRSSGSGSGAGATSSSSSSSYSSSGSGSQSGGGGGSGNFMFPTNNYPYGGGFPNGGGFGGFGGGFPGGFPPQDFNALFQQFLASLNAAQAYAAQNPNYASIFNQQIQNLIAQQQAAMAQNPWAFPSLDSNTITPEVRTSGANPVYTSSSVQYGPKGGYGQASSFPGGSDGLGVRIAEELPAPSGGGSFGVFTSSSSGSSDVNGKRTSFKTSTFGTNDNGKITFRTVNE